DTRMNCGESSSAFAAAFGLPVRNGSIMSLCPSLSIHKHEWPSQRNLVMGNLYLVVFSFNDAIVCGRSFQKRSAGFASPQYMQRAFFGFIALPHFLHVRLSPRSAAILAMRSRNSASVALFVESSISLSA